jgi:hypothetical protein
MIKTTASFIVLAIYRDKNKRGSLCSYKMEHNAMAIDAQDASKSCTIDGDDHPRCVDCVRKMHMSCKVRMREEDTGGGKTDA